jgi:hypothetical protein
MNAVHTQGSYFKVIHLCIGSYATDSPQDVSAFQDSRRIIFIYFSSPLNTLKRYLRLGLTQLPESTTYYYYSQSSYFCAC